MKSLDVNLLLFASMATSTVHPPEATSKAISSTHRRQGFTLLEVIVTLAIIGIIAAIAIPIYSNYITSTKRTKAETTVEQFGVLLESYRAERGSFPANGTTTYTETYSGGNATNTISPILPDFKPRSGAAQATSFHYRMTITGSGTAAEQAVTKAIGVDNIAGKFAGVNAQATF